VSGSCSALTAVTLSGSGTGGVTAYEWKDASGAVVGSTASSIVNLMPGNHDFTLTTTGACGAATATDSVHVTVSPVNGLPIAITMGTQINGFGLGYDTITPGSTSSLLLEVPAADTTPGWEVGPWTRQWLTGGNWYFTPVVNLRNACYDVADLSSANISITARYLNDVFSYADPNTAYIDAPIGIRFTDVAGKRGLLNTVLLDPNNGATNNQWWLYGPGHAHDPNVMAGLELPPWETYSSTLYFDTQVDGGDTWIHDVGFDPTKVVSLEFWGTDWYGTGYDFVDLKDLGFTSGVICGDANCDGLVNNGDIDAFVMALTDPGNYATTYGCAANCDTNGDTLVNNGDIDSFVAAVVGGGCP
jgi:hypothetical protein